MSGHNKWSKIKHKKAATDAERSKLFSKHAMNITVESRKVKGDLTAPNLIAAIERTKKDSMPKDNIERAVAKGAGTSGEAFQEVLFETFGPGGVAILISAITDNNNRTSNEIRHLLSKAGYQLGTPGSAAWTFTKTTDGYIPATPLAISNEEGEKLANLIELLENNDDVQEIFTTADSMSEL